MKDALDCGGWKTLHVAPENTMEGWLRSVSSEYVSMDLVGQAMVATDLTNMAFPNQSFSLVWCSHVLEHIHEDTKALREMHRVCTAQRLVIIQVPVWRQQTYYDPQLVDEHERLTHFYQRDHVRLYGLDIQQRIADAGFHCTVRRAQDFDPALVFRHALSFVSTNKVFVCTKN